MKQSSLSLLEFLLRRFFEKIYFFIRSHNREMRNMTIAIAFVVGVAFCVEYFGFGQWWNEVPKEDRGVFVAQDENVQIRDFERNEDGGFVSLKEGAILTVKTDARYVRALRIHISENIASSVVVEYMDSYTGETIMVSNDLQSYMLKKKEQMIDFLIYPVQGSPQEVVIRVDRPGVVISRVEIDNAYLFNPYRFVFFAGIGFLLLFFFLYRKKIGERPEVGFLAVALVCGTVLSIAGPTYTYTWDEKIHYQRSERLAFGMREIAFRPGATPGYLLEEERAVNAYMESHYKKPKKEPKIKDFSYVQLGYTPSAVALTIGELLPLSHTAVFKFGRWINVFVFSLIVFFAIRKLRSGKMIMAMVALLPTSIFLASNYGYDSWVTAFVLLGCAYVFSALQELEKKLTVREMFIMIGAFVVGLGPKAIYFPLMLVLFLLPRNKFQSAKQYKKFMVAVILSIAFVAGSFLVPFLVEGPGEGDKRGGDSVNAVEQVQFILSHPVVYAKILLNFMGEYVHPKNSIGYTTFFAYLGSFSGFVLALILLLSSTLIDRNSVFDRRVLTWKFRMVIFGSVFAVIALFSTALYIVFTLVGSTTISGVQHRYLLPVIFPFLFAVGGFSFSFLQKQWINMLIVFVLFGFSAGLFLYGVWEIVIPRYY